MQVSCMGMGMGGMRGGSDEGDDALDVAMMPLKRGTMMHVSCVHRRTRVERIQEGKDSARLLRCARR